MNRILIFPVYITCLLFRGKVPIEFRELTLGDWAKGATEEAFLFGFLMWANIGLIALLFGYLFLR